jgi:hypothetical protein
MQQAHITASTTGNEHMVLIAVNAEHEPIRTEFTFLAQPTIEQARGAGRVRGTGAPSGLDSVLGEMFQNALYSQGKTRGLSAIEAKNYTTRIVSWRTIKRKPGGQ